MFTKILEHKATLIIAALAVIGAAVYGSVSLLGNHGQSYLTVKAAPMDLTETITATGQVDSENNVSLAFNNSGVISSIKVKVGDTVSAGTVLGTIDSSSLYASLQGAQADVLSAQANLASLQKGTRPEQLAVYQQALDTANTALDTAVRDSYVKTEAAVREQADVVFQNPDTVNPQLLINTPTDDTKRNIEFERLQVHDKLAAWKTQIASSTRSDASISMSEDNMTFIKSFIDQLSSLAGLLTTSTTGMTQAQISTDQTAIYAAENQINGAISELTAATQAVQAAQAQLTLQGAPSTAETIEQAQATIAKTQAQVASIQSQIAQNTITAPFSGVVSAVNPKVGEVVMSGAMGGTDAFDLVGQGVFKIDVPVSEDNIAKITLGDKAIVTLDAYGAGTTFDATVSQIDPAETMVNGVGTYKVTLLFAKSDDRIKVGMTANVSIVTNSATQAIAVPSSAIITKDADKYVLVSTGVKDQFAQRKVTVGITDAAAGYTAVTSGLQAGEIVATFGSGSDSATADVTGSISSEGSSSAN